MALNPFALILCLPVAKNQVANTNNISFWEEVTQPPTIQSELKLALLRRCFFVGKL
jgi:hypothetical protein